MSQSLKHLISINDLNTAHFELILKTAQSLKDKPQPSILNGKIIANCFFEPSTRTRLSFETAALRLGAQTIGFSEGASNTSMSKGESLSDCIKIVGQYADALVLRHGQDGAARLASLSTHIPVINAGDGSNQHPSQTLLDLFTIQACQGRLNKLHIAFVGDLKYGRTVHSLVQACSHYQTRFYFVSPDSLTIPKALADLLRERGAKYSFHESLDDVLPKLDILYMTRLQRERFIAAEQSILFNQCRLLPHHLEKNLKSNLKILHPLPRVDEIDLSIDESPYAYYFEQAKNGLYVRQAILSLLLNQQES